MTKPMEMPEVYRKLNEMGDTIFILHKALNSRERDIDKLESTLRGLTNHPIYGIIISQLIDEMEDDYDSEKNERGICEDGGFRGGV